MSNSVDPDETSHLDLYCSQKSIIIACGKERVKAKEIITSLRFLLDLFLFLIVTRKITENGVRFVFCFF